MRFVCAFPPQKRHDSSIYIIVPPIALVLSGPRSDANCVPCVCGNLLFFAGTAEKRAVMKTMSIYVQPAVPQMCTSSLNGYTIGPGR